MDVSLFQESLLGVRFRNDGFRKMKLLRTIGGSSARVN